MAIQATGKDLVQHWDDAGSKGLMNRNTAHSLRVACEAVLGVLEGWAATDIRALDLDDVVTRFRNLRHKTYRPSVLATYENRFRRAYSSYMKYLDDPGAWRPARRAVVRQRTANKPAKSPPAPALADEGTEPATEFVRLQPRGFRSTTSSWAADPTGIIDYPFPLRDGVTVHLYLPRDLKPREIKRLTAFMEALVAEENQDT